MNRGLETRLAAALALALAAAGCTGGSESNAAVATEPAREAPASATASSVDAKKELRSIGEAIPLYQGAQFRDDLTQRDAVMIRSRYGAEARVYTLATDDSFPQVYHYYTTYLSQFRAFPAEDTWPAEQKNWRTLEVQLNAAMQDPFIPGEALDPKGEQVLLQVAETEAEPRTVIRYIVTPAPPAGLAGPELPFQSASVPQAAAPVSR